MKPPRFFVPKKVREPTNAVPGSEEKIKVLMDRVASGYECHHPEDRMIESAPYQDKYDYSRLGVAKNRSRAESSAINYDGGGYMADEH